MKPINPEALHGQTFSKTESGYHPGEVDDYIRRLTENYSLLYRENASLLKQLRETGAKLRTLETELSNADHILKDAQAQKDKIIEDAYLKADNILASVQMNCDSILRHFKEKADAQEKTLSDMKNNILKFKNDLFERYRFHIELIENLFPANEEEKHWTSDAYTQHIVAELKRKISDQYEFFPETSMEFIPQEEPKPKNESKKHSSSDPNTCNRTSAKKKTAKKPPSIMDLIDEYEDSSLTNDTNTSPTRQFMLDFDHPSGKGVIIDKQS